MQEAGIGWWLQVLNITEKKQDKCNQFTKKMEFRLPPVGTSSSSNDGGVTAQDDILSHCWTTQEHTMSLHKRNPKHQALQFDKTENKLFLVVLLCYTRVQRQGQDPIVLVSVQTQNKEVAWVRSLQSKYSSWFVEGRVKILCSVWPAPA